MSITVLMGAGSVIEIGGPTTNFITDKIKLKAQIFLNGEQFFIKKVASELEKYYAPDTVNFEDIFHALEQIDTYKSVWGSRAAKEFAPAFGAFSQAKDSVFFQNDIFIQEAKDDLIKVVAEMIYAYDKDCLEKKKMHGTHNFFKT
jgi:hypothetical protein